MIGVNITYDLSKIVSAKIVEQRICDYYTMDAEVKIFGKVIFPKSVKSITGQRYSLSEFETKIKDGEIKCFIKDGVIYQKPFVSLKFINGDIHEEFFDNDSDAKAYKFKVAQNMEKPF